MVSRSNKTRYFIEKKSFGFADHENLFLQDADTTVGEKRLSWNLNGSGGYRCGNFMNLYDNDEMKKVILYLN